MEHVGSNTAVATAHSRFLANIKAMTRSANEVLGHSFGAYTTLAITGARPVLDWLRPEVAPGHGLGPDLADPRIDGGVALWPPGDKYFIWLDGANHIAFSDSTSSGRRMLPSPSRDEVQPIVRASTLAFFDIYLKGEGEAKRELSQEALALYLHDPVEGIEVRQK